MNKIALSNAPLILVTFCILLAGVLFAVPRTTEARTIQFVGTSTVVSPLTSSTTLPLNNLAGGLSGIPAQGDLILYVTAMASTSNRDMIHPTGFTEVTDLYANDTRDTNLGVSYAFATSGPISGVVCPWASNNAGSVCFAMVFRGVDKSTPVEVSSTTAVIANNEDINCPAVRASTTFSLALCVGAAAGTNFDAFTSWPAGWIPGASTTRAAAAQNNLIGAFGLFSTTTSEANNTYDPPAFVMDFGTAANNSWAAVSLSLRPDQSRMMRLFSGYRIKIVSGTIKLFRR